jgi:hypothetical protein
VVAKIKEALAKIKAVMAGYLRRKEERWRR